MVTAGSLSTPGGPLDSWRVFRVAASRRLDPLDRLDEVTLPDRTLELNEYDIDVLEHLTGCSPGQPAAGASLASLVAASIGGVSLAPLPRDFGMLNEIDLLADEEPPILEDYDLLATMLPTFAGSLASLAGTGSLGSFAWALPQPVQMLPKLDPLATLPDALDDLAAGQLPALIDHMLAAGSFASLGVTSIVHSLGLPDALGFAEAGAAAAAATGFGRRPAGTSSTLETTTTTSPRRQRHLTDPLPSHRNMGASVSTRCQTLRTSSHSERR